MNAPMQRGKPMSRLVWPWLLILCLNVAGIYLFLLMHRSPVLAIGIAVATIPGCYLLLRPSHSRAFSLMIMTLPFLAAFVIDIGGNLRIPYLFAILALLLGIHQEQLKMPKHGIAIGLLSAFVLYAVISTAFAARFDLSLGVVEYGFRTSEYRSLIQAGQLLLMLIFFYLTFNYLTSPERLHRLSTLITWSLAFVVIYGAYEFAATVSDLPFVNINSNPDDYVNRYAGTQPAVAGDVIIPRPRSILLEPLNVAIYILFRACLINRHP